MSNMRINFREKPAGRIQTMQRIGANKALGLGPGGMSRIETLIGGVKLIKAFAFDIGGTLAPKDDISPAMMKGIADLANLGKEVSIITGKSIKDIKKLVEGETGIASMIDPRNLKNFSVYGDRVTKVFKVADDGKLVEVSKIPFPASSNKELILKIVEKAQDEIQRALIADPSISSEIKELLAANPIIPKAGDEYIQFTSPKDIDIKGDKTGSKARKLMKQLLEAKLKEAGVLSEDLMIVLDGKKGAFIKSRLADKPGAIMNLIKKLGVLPAQVIYFGDQFAGGSTADLPVADTGIYCINVGPEKEGERHNILNTLTDGPDATLGFINEAIAALKSGKY